MITAMTIIPLMDVCAKLLGQSGIPIPQIIWGRLFFGVILILPIAWHGVGIKMLLPAKIVFHICRAILLIASSGFFFSAISFISIADSLAIFFVQPLLVTALSPLLLKEYVGTKRCAAVAIGFGGTLIIIRPGLQEFNIGMALALASGASMALYTLITRKYARNESPLMTTFHTTLLGVPMMSIALPFVWKAPSVSEWELLVLLAAIGVFCHFLIARAYTMAEASLLAPLAYTEMVMATVAGWWFFSEMPDNWTMLGVSILIACAIYICINENTPHSVAAQEFEQP